MDTIWRQMQAVIRAAFEAANAGSRPHSVLGFVRVWQPAERAGGSGDRERVSEALINAKRAAACGSAARGCSHAAHQQHELRWERQHGLHQQQRLQRCARLRGLTGVCQGVLQPAAASVLLITPP